MGSLSASLKLLNFRFNPEEEIIGKRVYDCELIYIGLVKDWTYSPDRELRMVVKIGNKGEKNPTILIPFSDIDRVGQRILLKTKTETYLEDLTKILYKLRKTTALNQFVKEFLENLDH